MYIKVFIDFLGIQQKWISMSLSFSPKIPQKKQQHRALTEVRVMVANISPVDGSVLQGKST